MDKQQFLTWEEAVKAAQEGKRLLFHHEGKAVPVDKDTTIQELQWKYFGVFGLSWHDILNGKYSLAKYVDDAHQTNFVKEASEHDER